MNRYIAGMALGLAFVCISHATVAQEQARSSGMPADSSGRKKQNSFYNVTTISLVSFYGQFLPGVQTAGGWRFNRYLSAGIGAGYEHFETIPLYENFKGDLSLLPVFADVRFTPPVSGYLTPVVALDLGYKILLNKPVTQTRTDSVFGNVLSVESKDIYSDYNEYHSGGFFLTVEAGANLKVAKHMGLYLSVDYSLWSVSGTYYLSDKSYLLGSNGWSLVHTTLSTDKSLAYVHAFMLRLGITF